MVGDVFDPTHGLPRVRAGQVNVDKREPVWKDGLAKTRRQPSYPQPLGDAADDSDVWLQDIHDAGCSPLRECITKGLRLTSGNGNRANGGQLAKVLKRLGVERVLKPCDIAIFHGIEKPFRVVPGL